MKQPFLSLLLLVTALACSSEQPGPGASNARLRTESGFCTEWARVVCNANVVAACDFDDGVDECREWELQYCLDLIPPGYAPARAQDCIYAAKTAFSDANLTASEAAEVLYLGGDCAHLIDGGILEGDVCVGDFDCNTVEDNVCVIKPGDLQGTCQVPVAASGGDRCDDPAAVCEEGSFCDTTSNRCFSVLESGDACTSDAQCGSDSRCIIAGDGSGLCTTKLDARQACATDAECLSGFCVNETCRLDVNLSLDVPFCIEQ